MLDKCYKTFFSEDAKIFIEKAIVARMIPQLMSEGWALSRPEPANEKDIASVLKMLISVTIK